MLAFLRKLLEKAGERKLKVFLCFLEVPQFMSF